MSALSLILVTPAVRSRLYRYVRGFVRDAVTAESVVSDAMTRAMERVEIDRPVKFLGWLFSIVANSCRHLLRDRKSHARAIADIGVKVERRDAFAQAITKEALLLFDGATEKMTDRQRQILMMRIVDRLSFDEIGEQLGMRAGAARAVIHRAKHRLAEWLEYMRAV